MSTAYTIVFLTVAEMLRGDPILGIVCDHVRKRDYMAAADVLAGENNRPHEQPDAWQRTRSYLLGVVDGLRMGGAA